MSRVPQGLALHGVSSMCVARAWLLSPRPLFPSSQWSADALFACRVVGLLVKREPLLPLNWC